MSQLNDLWYSRGITHEEMLTGVAAITTQPYTEVNSKFGVQWELSFYSPALVASTGVAYVAIETGAKYVIIKDIKSTFTSDTIATDLFKGSTYTGGSVIPYYNLRDDSPVAGLVTFKGGITGVTLNTQVSPSIVHLGTVSSGNRTVSSITGGFGVERILMPNSVYVYRIRNLSSTTPSDVSGIVTWYEGITDYNPI